MDVDVHMHVGITQLQPVTHSPVSISAHVGDLRSTSFLTLVLFLVPFFLLRKSSDRDFRAKSGTEYQLKHADKVFYTLSIVRYICPFYDYFIYNVIEGIYLPRTLLFPGPATP